MATLQNGMYVYGSIRANDSSTVPFQNYYPNYYNCHISGTKLLTYNAYTNLFRIRYTSTLSMEINTSIFIRFSLIGTNNTTGSQFCQPGEFIVAIVNNLGDNPVGVVVNDTVTTGPDTLNSSGSSVTYLTRVQSDVRVSGGAYYYSYIQMYLQSPQGPVHVVYNAHAVGVGSDGYYSDPFGASQAAFIE